MIDLDKLNSEFGNKSEVEVVRLLTCNFDLGAFSLVEDNMSSRMSEILRNAIRFRTHLSMDPTTLDDFVDKIKTLVSNAESEFHGSASKLCGYAGRLMTEAKTFLGTPDELVSFNEFSYVAKLYPWWIRPVNKVFAPYVDQYINKQAFFCLPSFDLNSLKDKTDVKSVTETHITLTNKVKIPVVRVD